jgi:hypothetical protein
MFKVTLADWEEWRDGWKHFTKEKGKGLGTR